MQVEKNLHIAASPEAIWKALTDPQSTKQYFFGCEAVSDWKAGSPLHYQTVMEGTATVHVKGVIRAIEPERYLETTCYAPDNEGIPDKETVATYTLTRDGAQLRVTQGDFSDEGTFQETQTSWDMVLNGLKQLVETA